MTNDQIIEMAKQAGIEFATHIGITGKETTSTLGSQRIDVMQRFAQLVRNAALFEAMEVCIDQGELKDHDAMDCYYAIQRLKS